MVQEVPEISDGTVLIDLIVRVAGYRTKLTVRSTDGRIDPVGACVGMRGSRVKNIVRELNNEKIDIIPFSSDPIELLQNALSPIEIRKISVDDEDPDNRIVSIVVDDEDYPAVIGKKGMNARLNSELIHCELDVQRMSDYNRTMALQRTELASSEDATLDEPVTHIEGVSSLILEHLTAEGFGTVRKLLTASPEQLAQVSGISLEAADNILEKLRKQRM
jgi:N utilization substance protein A